MRPRKETVTQELKAEVAGERYQEREKDIG